MSGDNPLEIRVRSRLARLRADTLTRVMRPPAGVDLSSNDYLGLSTHPAVIAAFAAGVQTEGAGSTGSRLLRGERLAFSSLELRFASFKGTARALFFSSGYLANLAVLTTVAEEGDVLFSDALNHASLIDAARLSRATRVIVPHTSVDALVRLLDETPCAGLRIVAIESLFSMDGDRAPLADYAAVCHDRGAVLIVDEAHAVGVFGATGSGLIEDAGLDPGTVVSINPAGKALGVGGAFVAGSDSLIEYLVQRARPFVFSTASPPAMAHALNASLDLVRDDPSRRERLRNLAGHLRRRLRSMGIDVAAGDSHIIPIHIGPNDVALAVAEALQTEGFDVRAIRPPTVPEGTSRLRVSVNCNLDEATLDRFAVCVADAMKEAGLCSAASS